MQAFFCGSNSIQPMQKFPPWARWLAMDSDGSWWCYEAEPHQHDTGWYENEVGRVSRCEDQAIIVDHWRRSLRRLHQESSLRPIFMPIDKR